MSKKDDRAHQKREEILDAATRAFRDEGYESTSMDRIAEVAGASKRTVYNHFGSKEQLFQAVVAGMMDQLIEAKQIEFAPGAPLEEQLAAFARTKGVVSDLPDVLDLTRVVLGVFIRQPELAKETMERASAGEGALERWLAAARDAGALAIDDISLAAEIFWAMAAGALFWPVVVDGPLDRDARERIIGELVATFLARYRRR